MRGHMWLNKVASVLGHLPAHVTVSERVLMPKIVSDTNEINKKKLFNRGIVNLLPKKSLKLNEGNLRVHFIFSSGSTSYLVW